MHFSKFLRLFATALFAGTLLALGCQELAADDASLGRQDDWPMWRCDAGRTGVSVSNLPDELHLQWTRYLPPIEPAFRNSRLHFDAGYEPIIADDLLIVGSSADDSVTAYDVSSGEQRWCFYTEGPVRFAPAAWHDRIFVGSDDGCLYCLRLATGEQIWRRRAVPSTRKVLGNRRLISVWPVRGGPVVADDRVYFAAGVFPFEGVFVYAIDAETGDVVWRNDRLGFLYGPQPHGTEALSGLAPQGYLVADGDQLIVPCGSAYPATLDRETGKLISFQLPSSGREPGGWFAAIDADTARDLRRGKLVLDNRINRQQHEDKIYTGRGESGIQSTITIGDRIFDLTQPYPGVDGTVHSILAAAGRLFVVTREDTVSCFAAEPIAQAARHDMDTSATALPGPAAVMAARQLIQSAGRHRGYAVVWGLRDGQLLEAIVGESDLVVIGIEPDARLVRQLRRHFQRRGLYGSRISLLVGDAESVQLPRYLADLVTTETPERFSSADSSSAVDLDFLRPYGGAFCLIASDVSQDAVEQFTDNVNRELFDVSMNNDVLVIRRAGPLPGATDYTGGWTSSSDALVRAPLSLLWFDDTVAHFKRSPQPQFLGGTMVSYLKDWRYPRDPTAKGLDYPLKGPVLSDVYTGRVLEDDEALDLRASLDSPVAGQREPNQYRPPKQKNDWSPEPPQPGRRLNPLTGREEPRAFPKEYGCDGGFDYGDMYTMRSATAAFYDKTIESGTVHIAGPRSGCTNSVIPACGLLNVPYFYEGCTCSYPLPTGLALVSMPETFEQWSVWGSSAPTEIQRIGINFGAPGDRITRGGTLWLDFPRVGGPSPELQTDLEPADPQYHYEHSLWYSAGEGWPWVNGSCVEGLRAFTLGNLKPGTYTIRLFFADRANQTVGQRIQDIGVQGASVLKDFDIVAAAEGAQCGVVHTLDNVQIDGDFDMRLSAKTGSTRINGIELIRDGLSAEDLPKM